MPGAHYRRLDRVDWPEGPNGADIEICLSYWEELRAGRGWPAWKDFDWLRIPPEIIPYFAVVDVIHDPFALTYRFFGTGHARAHGIDLTGRSPLDMVPGDVGRSMFAQYKETAERGEPLLYLHVLAKASDGSEITETSLRLPFSSDGARVTQIVAFTDLRKDHERARRHFNPDREPGADRSI